MVAKAERGMIRMRRELLERIDDFRFARRLPSRAEAIRQLIEAGLRHAKEPKQTRGSSS
jgi:metal-responsive CopG/Arc/MetJ family transcriptional regulator